MTTPGPDQLTLDDLDGTHLQTRGHYAEVTRTAGTWRVGREIPTIDEYPHARTVGLAQKTYDVSFQLSVPLAYETRQSNTSIQLAVPHLLPDVRSVWVLFDPDHATVRHASFDSDELTLTLDSFNTHASGVQTAEIAVFAASPAIAPDPTTWNPDQSREWATPPFEPSDTTPATPEPDTMASFDLHDYIETETRTETTTETIDAPAERNADGEVVAEEQVETTVEREVEVVAGGCGFGACGADDLPMTDAVPVVAGRDDAGNVTSVDAWCEYCAQAVFGDDVTAESDHAFVYGDVREHEFESNDERGFWSWVGAQLAAGPSRFVIPYLALMVLAASGMIPPLVETVALGVGVLLLVLMAISLGEKHRG